MMRIVAKSYGSGRALRTGIALTALATLVLSPACGGRTQYGQDAAISTDAATAADAAQTHDAATAADAAQTHDAATAADAAQTHDAATATDSAVFDAGSGTCGSVGGTCRPMMWDMCPAGQEPYGNDDPLDCNGRCCVPAPPSTCSSASNGNCLPGAHCQGCWMTPSGPPLTCEPGRVCCEWMCD